MTKTFKKMSRDERAEVVREEMKIKGNSSGKIAKKHGVSLGVIVAIRRDYKIPSTNKATRLGKEKEEVPAPAPPQAPKPQKVPKPPIQKEAAKPPDAGKNEVVPVLAPTANPQAKPEPPRLKFAHHESLACKATDEQGRQCGYLRAPDSLYCNLPQHQALEKKTARRA